MGESIEKLALRKDEIKGERQGEWEKTERN